MKQERKQRGIYEKLPGSGVWWTCWFDQFGRRHREKAGTKSAALSLYRKRKTQVLEGRKLPEKLRRAPVSFREIAQDALAYSRAHKRSYRDDEYRMATVLEWFGPQPAEFVTPQEIESRFEQRTWAPATCNRYRALLSFTFRIAIRNGKLTENPIRKLARRRENNGRVRFLDVDDEAVLRAKIRELYPEHETELDLALHTGMRRNEQYLLRWEHTDFRLGLVNVVDSKNGQRRAIPMNEVVREALGKLCQQRDASGYAVPGTSRDRGRDWRRWFEDAVRKAGLQDFCWHDLRHTFASRLVMAGVDLRTVAELLGHKTLAMVMRYAHLAPGHVRQAVDRLVPERSATKTATSVVETSGPAPAFVN